MLIVSHSTQIGDFNCLGPSSHLALYNMHITAELAWGYDQSIQATCHIDRVYRTK